MVEEVSAIYSYQFGVGYSEWNELYIPSHKIVMHLTFDYNIQFIKENVDSYDMSHKTYYFNVKLNTEWIETMKAMYQEKVDLENRTKSVGSQFASKKSSLGRVEEQLNRALRNIEDQYSKYFQEDYPSVRFHADPEDIKVVKELAPQNSLNISSILQIAEGFFYKFVSKEENDALVLKPVCQTIMNHISTFPESKIEYRLDIKFEEIKIKFDCNIDQKDENFIKRFWNYVRTCYPKLKQEYQLTDTDFEEFETLIHRDY